ncbi:MAG: cupin domain-containing protein [Burkholderiales bacterium]
MAFQEQLPRRQYTKKEMMKRVARFSKLKGFDGGLPDSYYAGAERTLYNVIGFQPPADESGGMQSPVGAQAARMAAIKVTEGFNLGYCRALPGQGPMMHNHDTNETFIAMTGVWRASWENTKGKVDYVDLQPLDVISFPPGAIRRFENVTKGPKHKHSILMFVIGGDVPQAEFTAEAVAELMRAEVLDEKMVLRLEAKRASDKRMAEKLKGGSAKKASTKPIAKKATKKAAKKRA